MSLQPQLTRSWRRYRTHAGLRLGHGLICVGLLLVSVLSAASAPTVDTPVALLEGLKFPTGQRVSYEETQMNAMLRTPVTQSGFVEITPDGAFVMQVTTPRPEQRRLENGKLSLKRPSKAALKRNPSEAMVNARARTLTLNPEHGGHLVLLAITQVLSGDIDALRENFQLQGTAGEPWSVVLTPKNAKVKRQLQRLELKGVKGHLHSLYTERSGDAWQRLTFATSDP